MFSLLLVVSRSRTNYHLVITIARVQRVNDSIHVTFSLSHKTLIRFEELKVKRQSYMYVYDNHICMCFIHMSR